MFVQVVPVCMAQSRFKHIVHKYLRMLGHQHQHPSESTESAAQLNIGAS